MPDYIPPELIDPPINLVPDTAVQASVPDYGPLVLDSYGNWIPAYQQDRLLWWRLAIFILIALLLGYLAWRINQ